MDNASRFKLYAKRVGAVAGAFLLTAIVTTLVDLLMYKTGIFPPTSERLGTGPLVLATAYRILFNIGGCYLAARWAPDFPMNHALALGCLGFVLSVVGTIAIWSIGPIWYPLFLVASALPCAWVGGKLYTRKLEVVA